MMDSGIGKKDVTVFLTEEKRKAIARLHKAEMSSIHSDNDGVYRLYPDGHKEQIKQAIKIKPVK
jgi:hypothetical protein